MPTIDIDSQTAHDAAARELARPIYPKAGLTDRIAEWFNEMLHRLTVGAANLPGGWLALVVLGLLAAAAVIVAVRVARRTMGRRADGRLYGTGAESSADHRLAAQRSAARGDWAGAIRHRVRAIGRSLEENGVLTAIPGRTAGELARDAGVALPELAGDIGTAAGLFNDVTYGEQPGSESDYGFVATVDDRLRTAAGSGGRPPVIRQRWRTARWVLLGLVVITAFAAVSAWLTTPRLGGRMDPRATSPIGAHALVTLLRDRGVDVVVADSVDEVERAARPDTQLLLTQLYNTRGEGLMRRLATVPGDRLLVEPTVAARDGLASGVRVVSDGKPSDEANCSLREANQAGTARMDGSSVYDRAADAPLTRCYGGSLVRFDENGRSITVVGSSDFMTNAGLLKDGNAALAMNLAGTRDRLIWYAPQRIEGDPTVGASITDLIPKAFAWVVVQLCVVVALLAVWRGRRLGPCVAERLPVVVRASETTEGRARLYRSTRARGPAATALRAATLQRVTPRLGMGGGTSDEAVITAVAARCRRDDLTVRRILFGPEPATDAELLELAKALDDIERQVNSS